MMSLLFIKSFAFKQLGFLCLIFCVRNGSSIFGFLQINQLLANGGALNFMAIRRCILCRINSRLTAKISPALTTFDT